MLICLRCNGENDDLRIECAHCGADMYINKKTKHIAVKLYNKGLVYAKERKLTDAAEAINKSLYFDRFNIDALNVLGLIYFELGMIADALKQWAISASYLGDKNLARVYLARIKDNVREMEKMDDAVKMYNQGLVNIKNNNDDMAIIQLKKAIEQNPKLIEAKNLLALVYTSSKDSQNAAQLVDSVCAHDITNEKALSLKDNLNFTVLPGGQRYKQVQHARQEAPPLRQSETYIVQKSVKRFGKFPLSEVISLVMGAACAVAAMYFLVVPSIETENKQELERLQASIAAMQQTHEKTVSEKETEIEQLNEINAELERANAEIASRTELLEKQQKIMTAAALSAAGNIRESAAIIKDLDTTGLSDVEMSQYNSVKEAVYPQMAKALFDDGRAAYNSRNYPDAKTAFTAGLEYGMIVSNAGDAYYYLGRISEEEGDLAGARQNYERTVNEFSACTQYYNASNRLRALSQ